MKILVIDDQRIFKFPGAVHATTADEGKRLLLSQEWDEVWLDHDLGDYQDGGDIVRYIATYKPKVATFIVHSMNPVGAKYMVGMLMDAEYDVRRLTWTKATLDAYLDMKAIDEQGRNPFLKAERET